MGISSEKKISQIRKYNRYLKLEKTMGISSEKKQGESQV